MMMQQSSQPELSSNSSIKPIRLAVTEESLHRQLQNLRAVDIPSDLQQRTWQAMQAVVWYEPVQEPPKLYGRLVVGFCMVCMLCLLNKEMLCLSSLSWDVWLAMPDVHGMLADQEDLLELETRIYGNAWIVASGFLMREKLPSTNQMIIDDVQAEKTNGRAEETPARQSGLGHSSGAETA